MSEQLRATVAALIEKAQNAVWNGWDESDRVATEVTDQLVGMINEGGTTSGSNMVDTTSGPG